MMKRFLSISLIAAVALTAGAKSPKRGVSENNFSMGSMLESLEPGVGWYYNWGNTPGRGYQDQVISFEGMEFVPMCWNANYNADNIRNYCKTHPQTKYLLGFNEPNFTKQANMTPQKAAEEWPKVQALAKELGLKLVAPALNYSPNPPYTDPLKWMDEFVAIVGNDAFDYTAIHSYGGPEVMKKLATDFHDRYGKDVWVTEFCYWPNEGNQNDYVSPETQIASMVVALEWLETTPWIFRYAWFKALGNSDSAKGPNYGLLVHEGTGTDPWGLSEQGKVYVGLHDFDQEKAYAAEEIFCAAHFMRSDKVSVGSTKDEVNPGIIEISGLTSGASVDYRFNVSEEKDWLLRLRVSGKGEPERFDPALVISEVDAEGNEIAKLHTSGKFTLSGDNAVYKEVNFPVSLTSGQHIIRIQDANPYSPSGIRISTVTLTDATAVGRIEAEAAASTAVYNMQSVLVGESLEGLAPGIYIQGGKKVLVK